MPAESTRPLGNDAKFVLDSRHSFERQCFSSFESFSNLPVSVTSPSSQPETLVDYVAVVRRRKWIVLQALLIVPLAALLFSLAQSAQYEATADVVLSQESVVAEVTGITDPTATQDPIRLVQTEAAVARLPQVAEDAASKAHISGVTAANLLRDSTVTSDPNANQLHFKVTASTPDAALRLSSAYGASFIRYQAQLQTIALQRAREQVDNRLAQLRSQGQVKSALYTRLTNDEQQLNALELLHSSTSLLNPPQIAAQTRPRFVRNVALGVIVGLALGIVLAFLSEAFDRRVRSGDEIRQELGLPVLARLPEQPRRYRRALPLSTIVEDRGPTVEAFRRLRTRLDFANLEIGARTIMVTSAVKQEGKSTTAANLAVSLASTGTHVILVDLDLREPAITRLFGLGRTPGVVDIVRGRNSLESSLVAGPHETPFREAARRLGRASPPEKSPLQILPAGLQLPDDPTSIVARDELWALMSRVGERADLVLIDAPPQLSVAEPMIIASRVDALLVVSRVGVVPRRALTELREALDGLSTPSLGLVIAGDTDYATYGYGEYGYERQQLGVAPAGGTHPEAASAKSSSSDRKGNSAAR